MALGIQFMGSKATVCAQFEQIKSDKMVAVKAKAKNYREKVKKASAYFELFKSGLNMAAHNQVLVPSL